ncbi:MAG: HNH endonuclease [Alphaproteobacteria bacterium]|jgi:hypothetical protein|nr:HNH endonuclease [Alphaproteobacteria bacterium]
MKNCIYCHESKSDDEFSLEHVIPQFMGGALVSDKLKTRDVCRQCNNNLGLFVDAAFEKDFLVFNNLNAAAHAFFDPDNPSSLPLHCMGASALTPPNIKETEVCEYWIGPLGEQVFWIRPSDKRLYWYSGGNPRTVKKQNSVAYFIFSERTLKNPILSWLSFRDAFVGRPVKKVMCSVVSGADPKAIGFSEPDSIDLKRIEFFLKESSAGKRQKCQLLLNVSYDKRFMAKLAIGVAHALFRGTADSTTYMNELYKGLWYREGGEIPKVLGSSALTQASDNLKELCGIKYAVTVGVFRVDDKVVINLNINQQLNWVVQCAVIGEIPEREMMALGEDGLCVILFKPIGKCVELPFVDFLAHKTGDIINEELSEVETRIRDNSGYFANL